MAGNAAAIDSRQSVMDNGVGSRSTEMSDVEVRILGPLEVWVDGRRVDLGGGRQRSLLAILALHANEVVPSERLIDELWGGQPPPTAQKALQNLVSHLRSAITPVSDGRLLTQSPGYELRLDEDALDAHRFEHLAAEARQVLEEDPARAAEQLREALALWRGEPLVDFAYEHFAQAEIARLEELRLVAVEDRIDADLALGRHAELVPELETLVAAHPLRERIRGQLMVALYRDGRQAEALETYRQARTAMHEELGLEPSAALKQLEQAILTQDPSLGPTPKLPPAPRARRRRRRRLVLVAAAAALLAVATAALGAVLLSRDDAGPTVVPNSLVKIDAETNEIVDVIPVGVRPGQVEIVGDYAFVAGQDDGTLSRVDRRSGAVTISGRQDASGSIAGEGDQYVWVASTDRPEASRVEVSSLGAFDRIRLPRYLDRAYIAVGGGSLWVSEYLPPAVSRWSLGKLELARRYRLSPAPEPWDVSFGGGAAWVALSDFGDENYLLRIDARTGRARRIPVGALPGDSTMGFGSLWAVMQFDGTVWRIDPGTGKPSAIINVPRAPRGVAAGSGSMWVTSNCRGTVSRIDPDTNTVVATIETGYFPQYVAAAGRFVWVGIAGENAFGESGNGSLISCYE